MVHYSRFSVSPFHLKTEADPVSQTLCTFQPEPMDSVQNIGHLTSKYPLKMHKIHSISCIHLIRSLQPTGTPKGSTFPSHSTLDYLRGSSFILVKCAVNNHQGQSHISDTRNPRDYLADGKQVEPSSTIWDKVPYVKSQPSYCPHKFQHAKFYNPTPSHMSTGSRSIVLPIHNRHRRTHKITISFNMHIIKFS
jgi:hypothetical protein